MDAFVPRVTPRLATTGQKVYKVVGLIYLEDMAKYGKTYGDLLGYLEDNCLKAAVSPIHDRDFFTATDVWKWCCRHIDPDTGDLDTQYVDKAPYVGKRKKPHVHILLTLPRQATAQEFTDLMADFMEIRPTMWEKCVNEEGSLRYMAHLGCDDKAHYDKYEIHGFGGIDLSCLDKVSDETMSELTTKIVTIIRHNDKIRYFYQLLDYVMDLGNHDLVSCVYGKHAFFSGILRSKMEHRRDDAAKRAAASDAAKRAGLIG